jgi:hypothetical protein
MARGSVIDSGTEAAVVAVESSEHVDGWTVYRKPILGIYEMSGMSVLLNLDPVR